MSAARDGVERIGNPVVGSSSQAPGSSSPPHGIESNPAINLNENLRNIGKFFRRDMGGFGGRFGTNRTTDETGK